MSLVEAFIGFFSRIDSNDPAAQVLRRDVNTVLLSQKPMLPINRIVNVGLLRIRRQRG